jgi:RIO-like serine/threonine protein kinase
MTIQNLERALRKGSRPEDIGATPIGKGIQKTAYLYVTTRGLKVIIKLQTGGYRNEKQIRPPNLTKFGIATCYQTRAGQWVIQEYTRVYDTLDIDDVIKLENVVKDLQHKVHRGDYHYWNFGMRDDGSIVCFDW